jgi:hypothetical protein
MKYFLPEGLILPYLFHRAEGGFTGFWKKIKNLVSPGMGFPVYAVLGDE